MVGMKGVEPSVILSSQNSPYTFSGTSLYNYFFFSCRVFPVSMHHSHPTYPISLAVLKYGRFLKSSYFPSQQGHTISSISKSSMTQPFFKLAPRTGVEPVTESLGNSRLQSVRRGKIGGSIGHHPDKVYPCKYQLV